MKKKLKRYFITGLLIWVPLGMTIWVLSIFIKTMDQSIVLLPKAIQPKQAFGFEIPGLGVILTVAVIFITGLFAANMIGQRLVDLWERLLSRIPIVKSIYQSVKQVSEAVFADQGAAFHKVLLVRFPHTDAWTLAFQTAVPSREIRAKIGDEYVGVYVPTTPNPTSGYYVLMHWKDVIEVDMSVDMALKCIISMGVATSKKERGYRNEP